MTTNRKAKTAARALAAETGRSYTHARRLEVDSPASEASPGPLAELHREALAFAELLEQADPFLTPWGQAARRLAEVDDAAEFHAAAVRLAWDIDNLRATPGGNRCDALYRWIARNRYRWFGRKDACPLPPPGLRERFLDDPAP